MNTRTKVCSVIAIIINIFYTVYAFREFGSIDGINESTSSKEDSVKYTYKAEVNSLQFQHEVFLNYEDSQEFCKKFNTDPLIYLYDDTDDKKYNFQCATNDGPVDDQEEQTYGVTFTPSEEALNLIEKKGQNYNWDLSIQFKQKEYCRLAKNYKFADSNNL